MSMGVQEEEDDGKKHKRIKGRVVTVACSNRSGNYSRDIDGSDFIKRIFRMPKQS